MLYVSLAYYHLCSPEKYSASRTYNPSQFYMYTSYMRQQQLKFNVLLRILLTLTVACVWCPTTGICHKKSVATCLVRLGTEQTQTQTAYLVWI